jgi:ribose transport system permease protein
MLAKTKSWATFKLHSQFESRPVRAKTARPLRRLFGELNASVVVFLVLYAGIALLQPTYLEPASIMNFLRRAAPLVVLACGQLMVLLTGGFDLSAGALVTFTVLGGALLIAGDPSRTAPAIAGLYGIGLVAGLANGLIVALLKVPSIIATLGMLLVVHGAALLWSGGSPRGYLPDNFRAFGRFMWRDVPILHILPLAVPIMLAVALLFFWLIHRTVLGKRLLAVGDNPRAAELAGIRVAQVRVIAFVVSALSAVSAGILLGGFAGVSNDVGEGLELQAIAACVIGGTQLMGGGGSVVGAVAGALTLFALFTLLNLLGLPQPLREAVQGVILIAAVAVGRARTA